MVMVRGDDGGDGEGVMVVVLIGVGLLVLRV